MSDNFNKIFWGIIITLFNFNIGWLNILPDFIGYGLMISGLSYLYNETKYKEFYIAKNISVIFFILSIIGIFYNMDLMKNMNFINQIISTTGGIIQISLVFYMYSGVINLLENNDDVDCSGIIDSIIISRRNYVYIILITTLIMTFFTNIKIDILQIIAIAIIVVNICMGIRWAQNIRIVRNYFNQNIV